MSEGTKLVQTVQQKLSEKAPTPEYVPSEPEKLPTFVAMPNKVIVKEITEKADKELSSGLVIRADKSGSRTKKCVILSSGNDMLKTGDVVIVPTYALHDIDYGSAVGDVVYGCSIIDIFTILK